MICLFQEMIAMINPTPLKKLFKPYKQEKKSNIMDYIIENVGVRKFWKMEFEQECSKATDESCINTDCHYNYLDAHDDELYIELMQEIQAERLAIKERDEKARKKYGYN